MSPMEMVTTTFLILIRLLTLVEGKAFFTSSGENFLHMDPLHHVRIGAQNVDGHVIFHQPDVTLRVTNDSFSWSYRSRISHRPRFRDRGRDRRGLSDVFSVAGFRDECSSVKRKRAVVVYEGEPLRLLCDPCKSNFDDIRWTKQVGGQPEHRVLLDSRSDESLNRVVLDLDMSLEVRRAALGMDDGIYRCKGSAKYGADVLGLYHVEVIPLFLAGINEVRLAEDEKPAGEGAVVMKDRSSVEVYTHWTAWGRCSECDSAGERVKLGYCYAIRDLDHYAGGVPCHSKLLPDLMRQKILSERKDEKVIEECVVPCGQEFEDSPEAKWNIHGGALARVSGLKGPAVIRHVAREGSTTELKCPRIDIGMVATWYNGTRRIVQEELVASNGRLTQSIDGSLVIADVARYSAGSYECRVDRQVRAVYRLVVIDKRAATTEDIVKSVGILGAVLVAYSVLFIVVLIMRHCARVCTRKKRRR